MTFSIIVSLILGFLVGVGVGLRSHKKPSNKFDYDLWQWLKQEAKQRHCSIEQVVRDIVVAEVERQSEDHPLHVPVSLTVDV